MPGSKLTTTPKNAGPLLIEAVNHLQEIGTSDFARLAVIAILFELIKIRNQQSVVLTRPKDQPIEKVVKIIECHLGKRYRSNAPRLPQLVIYAAYQCLVRSVGRYHGLQLQPLARMKSADRKAGTVGDIVVTKDNLPVEAVEIKHGQQIGLIHVSEAIDKVRAQAVRRYYILSNRDINPSEHQQIEKAKTDFLHQNGCEIIINGVIDSLSYYLRLLPDTTEFIFAYTRLLEVDEDVSYEHRVHWNECCS